MLIRQISIFLENKKGRMAEIAGIISEAGVDIRALSVADTTDFGILRLIADDPEKAVCALKQADVTVSLTDVICVALDDTPGSFAKAAGVMAEAGIDIEYMYAFVSRTAGKAYVIIRAENPQTGADALRKAGFAIPDSAEIYGI